MPSCRVGEKYDKLLDTRLTYMPAETVLSAVASLVPDDLLSYVMFPARRVVARRVVVHHVPVALPAGISAGQP